MNRNQLILAGGLLSLAIGTTAALSSSKTDATPQPMLQANTLFPVRPFVASPSPAPQVAITPAPAIAPSPTYQSRVISTCYGRAANANFRSYPSLDPAAVAGVVANGDTVQLTGRVVQGDGEVWYEAIAPILYSSSDLSVASRFTWNQPGWISACFIGR